MFASCLYGCLHMVEPFVLWFHIEQETQAPLKWQREINHILIQTLYVHRNKQRSHFNLGYNHLPPNTSQYIHICLFESKEFNPFYLHFFITFLNRIKKASQLTCNIKKVRFKINNMLKEACTQRAGKDLEWSSEEHLGCSMTAKMMLDRWDSSPTEWFDNTSTKTL